MRTRVVNVTRLTVLILVLALLTGCAAEKAYKKAEKDMRRQDLDAAVLGYSKAVAMDPGNPRYSISLERAKLRASAQHFDKGRKLANAGQVELAIAEYQQTLLLNPGNQHAANELDRAVRDLRRLQMGPSEIEQLKERARRKDLGPPRLNPASNIPILLNFKDVEVKKIFEAISKASGINFIFDDKVDLDKPMTIDIGNVSLEQALDILMLQTKNFFKVIDEFTLLIAPDSRQKRQEYEDQVIRTFFLSNADTKTVVTLLRSLLQSRQIAENDDLNSVTIKDTPAKVAIAERIIEANDKAKGEVLIDVELMEINRAVAQTLGIDLSSKSMSLTFRGGEASLPLNNLDQLRQKGNWTLGVIPSVTIDFLKTDSDTKFLAKPQLRVAEGERAEILIGDRVPIPTTSFNTSQTVGGNIVPITSFTYQNVGITVQIEPRVHHNKEVTLTVQVEVSQVTALVETSAGQSQPVIGTRQIQTVIRLRDGETNLLAGLIQKSDSDNLSGVIGIMEVPILRRIFGQTQMEKKETEIVMTITPHIVRIPDITEEDLMTLWVGTEENMRLRGPARNALNQSPFGATVGASDPTLFHDDADPVVRTGGSVSQISTSSEVERDRANSAAAAAAGGAAGADQGGEQAPGQLGTDPQATNPPPGGGAGAGDTGDSQEEPEAPAGPAIVSLIPSSGSIHVGEPLVVEVVMQNATNVGSVPFHLRYDRSVLQFVGPATEGPFMRSDGANTVFLASDTGGGGEVVVGLSRMGAAQGATGSGTLAIFQFQAVAPGDAGFAFSGASVTDPQARPLPAAFNKAQVTVTP